MDAAQWDAVADCVNPILGIALLAAALLSRNPCRWNWLARALFAVALVYVLAHLPRWLHLFGERRFPSGHLAFALCAGASLVRFNRRWLFCVIAIIFPYSALILALQYHDIIDLAGAGFALPLTFWIHRARIGRELS